MKTLEEIQQYQNIRMRMIAKAERIGVSWARYYANLLDLGGKNAEQYLRNFFIQDTKRFNSQQLAKIYNDLNEHKEVEPFNQSEIKNEVLHVMGEIGKLSSVIESAFDEDEYISNKEASTCLLPVKRLQSITELLYLRLEETKAQG